MAVYINSIAQISTQEPLSPAFFEAPTPCAEPYCRSKEADYKQFIPMAVSRRMGPILKRAVAATVSSLREAGIEDPDAIVCGTGLGCIENTEKFLTAMIDNGESCLQPTFFINSTHNTIASQVATFLKCHGYNSTYAHLGVSFESALMDVLMQFELGQITNAVVGGHDEMTPAYFHLFDKVDYWNAPLGECAVSVVLDTGRKGSTKCVLKDVDLLYSSDREVVKEKTSAFLKKNGLEPGDIDILVTGRNGDERYDGSYDDLVHDVFAAGVPQCRYKHVFGESFTAPAFGLLLGAEIIAKGFVPEAWVYGAQAPSSYRNILIVNSFQSRDWSFILIGQ